MPHNSVLIVDDDTDVRENIAYALEIEGYEVQKAADGKSALELLNGLPPERLPGCIILDLMMPVMDGFEMLEVLKTQKESLQKIPVIISTARGTTPQTFPMPVSVDWIKKPMDLEELYKVVAKYCH